MTTKAKIISVGLVILLMGLIFSGCVPKAEYDQLETLVAEQDREIDRLRGEIETKDDLIADLEKEVLELQTEIDKLRKIPSAKIKMIFNPDPVICQSDGWRWKVALKEVGGVGVRLSDITMEMHAKNGIISSWNDRGWLEAINHYLPAFGEVSSKRHVLYQPSATHIIFIVTGVDDNGQAIITKGRVDLSPKKPGTAEIEISFSANPVPCENGMWEWRVIHTEVNGIGVTLGNWKVYIYRNSRLLDTHSHDKIDLEKYLPDAYLPAYGSWDTGAGWPCQDMTHVVFTITGIDDNGNEITATGRVELER